MAEKVETDLVREWASGQGDLIVICCGLDPWLNAEGRILLVVWSFIHGNHIASTPRVPVLKVIKVSLVSNFAHPECNAYISCILCLALSRCDFRFKALDSVVYTSPGGERKAHHCETTTVRYFIKL